MVRTQISLTEAQYKFLKELSRQTGESLSALIRKAVENLKMEELGQTKKAIELLGAFRADREDVSVRHDHYFSGKEKP